jgi:wyosine [tRNA(Phe)-imidazoG37] synthetase (radical SAM superfamily)
MTFLWSEHVYGPVRSRRMGLSLGLNLLPNTAKVCNYDCPYCECGWSGQGRGNGLPEPAALEAQLAGRLGQLNAEDRTPDAITMAGNGEPTLHPRFAEIVDRTIGVRDRLAPGALVAVLSNATRLDRPGVFNALLRVDERQLKLDAGTEETFRLVAAPLDGTTLEDVVDALERFQGAFEAQTCFVRGKVKGAWLDNAAPAELAAWRALLARLRPRRTLIYTLDREPAEPGLARLPASELEAIARAARGEGLAVEVY